MRTGDRDMRAGDAGWGMTRTRGGGGRDAPLPFDTPPHRCPPPPSLSKSPVPLWCPRRTPVTHTRTRIAHGEYPRTGDCNSAPRTVSFFSCCASVPGAVKLVLGKRY